MATAKQAILKAKLQGTLTEILVKTNAAYVMYDDNTTVAAKIAAILADVATKASSDDLTAGLALKAEKTHTHAQSEVTGLEDALTARPTTDAMNTAISTAISDLINGAPETYDTLKEIADYISSHADVVDTLNAAIGAKADNTEFQAVKAAVEALGAVAQLDKISEDYLSDELKEKVNAAAEGNHAHANKELLDTYTQTEADLADAVAKKHNHENKSVLDGITQDNVTAWNGKANVYYSATEPSAMTENDLWVQLVD